MRTKFTSEFELQVPKNQRATRCSCVIQAACGGNYRSALALEDCAITQQGQARYVYGDFDTAFKSVLHWVLVTKTPRYPSPKNESRATILCSETAMHGIVDAVGRHGQPYCVCSIGHATSERCMYAGATGPSALRTRLVSPTCQVVAVCGFAQAFADLEHCRHCGMSSL